MNAQGKFSTALTGKVLVFPTLSKPATRLLVPREHGTWGLLLFPLISGTIVGYGASPNSSMKPALWFLLAALSTFLIYQPLESLLGLSLDKSAFPAAAAHRDIIDSGVGSNRNSLRFRTFQSASRTGAGFWPGGVGMFCRTPAARQFATYAGSQAANRCAGTQFGSSRRLLRCLWPDRPDRNSPVACIMAFCGSSNRIRTSTPCYSAGQVTTAKSSDQRGRMLFALTDDWRIDYCGIGWICTAAAGSRLRSVRHPCRCLVGQAMASAGHSHSWLQ